MDVTPRERWDSWNGSSSPTEGAPSGSPPARSRRYFRLPARDRAPRRHAAKTTADYLKALRRRAWLVLLVALALILPGSVFVLRQKDVYRAVAQIRIDPPDFDHRFATIVPNGSIGQESPERVQRYVPDKIAELHSPGLAETVAARPVAEPVATPRSARRSPSWPACKSRRQPGLEHLRPVPREPGPGPRHGPAQRVAEPIRERRLRARRRTTSTNRIGYATENLTDSRRRSCRRLDEQIAGLRENTGMFTTDDRNIYQEQYIQLNSMLLNKKAASRRYGPAAAAHPASGRRSGTSAGPPLTLPAADR